MARHRTEEGRKVPAYAMLHCSDPFWKGQKDTHLSLGGDCYKDKN